MKELNEHEAFWLDKNTVVRQNGQIDRYCGLDFCSRSHYARNLCKDHYNRWMGGKELKPIASPGAFGLTTCVFPGCDGIATTVRPDSRRLCGAHVSQLYKGKELQPVGHRMNDGFNEDRTARTCGVCYEEKPLDEFYDRNQTAGRAVNSKATKCKACFKADVMYYQGKRKTKADGTDPKNYAGRPGLMEAVYEGNKAANRERARRKAEARNADL